MRFCVALLCGLGMLNFAGCEQRISKKDLGTVVFEVPAVHGSDKPPDLPELKGVQDARPPAPPKGP
jgi:hypothetical protein